MVNVIIVFAGNYVDAAETYVLAAAFTGMSWSIPQEYVLLSSLPASVIVFFMGLIIDKIRES